MAKACSLYPSKGKDLFVQLKQQFGRTKAVEIFLQGINPNFIQDYSKQLVLNEEGIPTYESLMKNPYIKEFIGENTMLESLNQPFTSVEDTADNYTMLIQEAKNFNDNNSNKDNYVAYVDYDNENKLRVKVVKKTAESLQHATDQYLTKQLNDVLVETFGKLGVTVGNLTEAETAAGRIGHIDFTKAKDIANGFISMIRIANNMEGVGALSEEFAHLIMAISKKDPLVERLLNSLADNPEALKQILGDQYEDVNTFYNGNNALMAEEALGKLLQQHLIKNLSTQNIPSENLFKRTINFIRNKFKSFKQDKVQRAIEEASTVMDNVAKQFLENKATITKEQIEDTETDAQFNDLSDRVKRNIAILKDADLVEIKRYKMTKDSSKDIIKQVHTKLSQFTQEEADTVKGICYYANNVLSNLKAFDEQFKHLSLLDTNTQFTFLREVRNSTNSYKAFINSLLEAYQDESMKEDNMFASIIDVNGEKIDMEEMIKNLSYLLKALDTKFKNTATPLFTEFLKPFLGQDRIVIPYGKNKGKEITIESLLREAESDISFFDRWLDSMGTSSDVLLTLFDAVVKKQNDLTRTETIEAVKSVQNLLKEAESLGITNFDYFFERTSDGKKTGNIISEVNQAQFEKDKKEFEQSLIDKYGKNAKGENADKKIAERLQWRNTHAILHNGKYVANPEIYRNEDYFNLSEDQRKILTEWLRIKDIYDSYLGGKTYNTKAIQIRKSGIRRFLDTKISPQSAWEYAKNTFTEAFLDKPDDEGQFGIKSGITDFSGEEYMQLPILYVTPLENPDELSDDVMGNLMAYIYMASNYKNMLKVVNQLEVGRILVTENRTVKKTRGGLPVVEKIKALGRSETNNVKIKESYIVQKLNDFFDSQVYGRYLKDQGSLGKANVNKMVSKLLEFSSLAQLGLNWCANVANVGTGIAMQNIEAAAGEYFSGKELLKADMEYSKAMMAFIPDISARIKTSKLALFDELFNLKQDYRGRLRNTNKKNLIERLYGANIAFLGQDAGDHWLYNRTAIAMCLRQKVKVPGKGEMSLWEAFEVRDKFNDDSGIKEIYLPEGTKDLEGNKINISDLSRKIAHVNHSLFGIYNEEDSNAANRVAVGRLLLQYKKWMKPQLNKRFQKATYVAATGEFEEGYYTTMVRIASELLRGQFQLGALKEEINNLSDHEKANLKRCRTELVQLLAVWACANLIKWPDDKERPWAVKFAEYMAQRMSHELGNLAPTPMFINENLKTLKTPIASLSAVQNMQNFVMSLANPADWNDELQTGPYKDHSTLYKNFMKAPIPGVAQYKMIDRFTDDLDTGIAYYVRSY